GLSGVHLISECALDKHVWRTPDVDHLGNTSRLRFSNSYISTDKQPAVRRTMGRPEKKQEKSFISVILIPKYENRLDFNFQGNSWQPDEQKCGQNKLLEKQKKYDRATDVSFLLLRPTADHPESCHHQGPATKDVAREDGHKRNPANDRLTGIVILSWTEKEELTPLLQIFTTIVKNIGVNLIPLVGIKIHVAGEELIMIFNLTRRRRGYLGVAWQRHGGRATTKERSIDLSRRMAGVRICIYVCTSAALAVA
ncbi:hypothetical protein ALC57_03426, partial [Trachymyrmex cornetzi]